MLAPVDLLDRGRVEHRARGPCLRLCGREPKKRDEVVALEVRSGGLEGGTTLLVDQPGQAFGKL